MALPFAFVEKESVVWCVRGAVFAAPVGAAKNFLYVANKVSKTQLNMPGFLQSQGTIYNRPRRGN